MHVLPYSLLVLCFIFTTCEALAFIPPPPPRSISLVRRARPHRNTTELTAWLRQQKDLLATKYNVPGPQHAQKRASGFNLLTNQDSDSTFYGSIAVGTPPVSYNVILDTGSSDLWLAASDGLSTSTNEIATFDPSNSSSFNDLKTRFSIQYGSGAAQGTLGQDVVRMAGLQVTTQTFAVVTQATKDLLIQPVSGLMGLGFSTIASSKATPFWQALNESGALDAPLMAFQLTRFLDVQLDTAQALEPGGTFTLGAVNTSLFTGDIDYQPIPDGQEGYWIQELTGLNVNGNAVSLPSGSSSYAAIDTGTTLISGPPDEIAALYAQIPNSQALTGDEEGFFAYPCSTKVDVTLRFGSSGISWPISSADFLAGQLDSGTDAQCLGAFFVLDTSGSSAPPWIVGDTFLKNVYSVFRASPPAVGLAQLSDAAVAADGKVGSPPSPTIGAVLVSATVTGDITATDRASDQNGAVRLEQKAWLYLLAGLVSAGILL